MKHHRFSCRSVLLISLFVPYAASQNLSAIGVTADKVGFWPEPVCPLMTQQRHWQCTAAMVLMPISAPIKVLV